MRKKLHTRQIKIEAFEIGENKILLVGGLDDRQPYGFTKLDGAVAPPGTIHDMRLELEVSVPNFEITAVRTAMPQVPHDGCRDVVSLTKALVGLRIVGGFTSEVKRRLGGVLGCAHLGSLILAMAPVAAQAFGSMHHSRGSHESDHIIVNSHLKNSCHMWREGGTYYEHLLEQMGSKENES